MRARNLALLPLVVLVLVAAGCGGSEESSADSTTATEELSTEATETTGGESTSTDESTITAIGDLSEECLSLAGVGAKYAQALQEAGGASADGDVSKYADAFDAFASEAPEAIRDDLQTIAKNFEAYAKAFQGLDLSSGAVPSADQLQKLQELSKTIDQTELQKASDNIEAWVQDNCAK